MAPPLAGRAENAVQARLLRLLRDEGSMSRVDLTDRLEVSRTTVAAEVARLVELGLVRDAGPAASRGGRRSTMVDLSPHLRFVGVAVGATSLEVAVTDARLEVCDRRSEAVDVRLGPEVVLARVLELIRELMAGQASSRPSGIGVGVPGPVNFHSGVPVSPPIMPGWDAYPVRDAVARELGCPVVLDNDVNLMALGEQQGGVARGARDFLFVKIGTGIGCGIVVDGGLYRGADGCAGDIGHIRVREDGPACACGGKGCLEAVFGGAALAPRRAGRGALRPLGGAGGGARAHRCRERGRRGTRGGGGDPVAMAMVQQGGRDLGVVLAHLVSFFNPRLLVIGGRVSNLGHALLAEVRGVVYRRSLPLATGNLPVVMSELGDLAGITGAVRLVSDQVFSTR
jgi:predicted NBD/HSP70 family sugar kinase